MRGRADERVPAEEPLPEGEKTVVLKQGRYVRLGVGKLDAQVSLGLSKRWVFEDALPRDLLASIRAHPRWKAAEPLPDADEPVETGSIRWPETGDAKKTKEGTERGKPVARDAAAQLWYVDSAERKELVVTVVLFLGHSLGRAKGDRGAAPITRSFDRLGIVADLESSRLTGVRWGGIALPDETAKGAEDTLHVGITGRLSAETRRALRSADSILSDELSTALGSTWRVPFENESHHGITLGWLGHEDLTHGIVFSPVVADDDPILFRYTISGEAFPLELVRRQLHPDGWPLVLRGLEYAGEGEKGTHVFRPIEYVLTRETPEGRDG